MTLLGWAGLAATTSGAALLYTVSGFGFALLAVPLYLLLIDPAQAVQLAIILSTALSFIVLPGLRRTIAPELLLRLTGGSLAGLPIGLFAFRYADPLLVRVGVGATILAFAVTIATFRRRGGQFRVPLRRTYSRDLVAGAVAGMATALVGMAGPPVLIYLLLAGTAGQTVRATLLAFFALSYGATVASMPRPSAFRQPPGWPPASSRRSLCSADSLGGRSATAWAATASPCWRSRCSPPPGFILWRPW
jgi:uncharacterized membrane protein YfcA